MGGIATVPNINIYQNLAAWVIETIQKHFFLEQAKEYVNVLEKSTSWDGGGIGQRPDVSLNSRPRMLVASVIML